MHRLRPIFATLPLLLTLAACGNGDAGGDDKTTIALFLPESKTTRYEAFDKPLFEKKVKALCSNCEVLYANADQDPAKQQSQVESALTQGADVLVLDAVDAAAAAPLVNQARQRDVPVIAYDRLISDISYAYYVSFDNVRVAEGRGRPLLEEGTGRAKTAKVAMITGRPPTPSPA